MPDPPDTIHVDRLRAVAHIGVPEGERALPQTLEISLSLTPAGGRFPEGDDFAATTDYDAVARAVRAEAARRPRQLIETLAQDVAALLLGGFPLESVVVEVRKFILVDNPGGVAVRVSRSR